MQVEELKLIARAVAAALCCVFLGSVGADLLSLTVEELELITVAVAAVPCCVAARCCAGSLGRCFWRC